MFGVRPVTRYSDEVLPVLMRVKPQSLEQLPDWSDRQYRTWYWETDGGVEILQFRKTSVWLSQSTSKLYGVFGHPMHSGVSVWTVDQGPCPAELTAAMWYPYWVPLSRPVSVANRFAETPSAKDVCRSSRHSPTTPCPRSSGTR